MPPPAARPARSYEPRKRPKQDRSRATFDAILTAAAQVLAAVGYASATTNAIAERAGVSIGSVYEYFPSKDAIFACLKEQLDQRTHETVIERMQQVDVPSPAAFLRGVLEARIAAALAQPELESLLREEIPASVFAEEEKRTFARFDAAMRHFAEAHPAHLRIADLDTSMELGVNVVELTIRHYAATAPDRLRDPALLAALSDMMGRWMLVDDPEGVRVTISERAGDDAKPYQERDLARVLEQLRGE